MKWFTKPKREFDHSGAVKSFMAGTYGSLSVSGYGPAPGHSLSVRTQNGEHMVSCSCGYGPKPL